MQRAREPASADDPVPHATAASTSGTSNDRQAIACAAPDRVTMYAASATAVYAAANAAVATPASRSPRDATAWPPSGRHDAAATRYHEQAERQRGDRRLRHDQPAAVAEQPAQTPTRIAPANEPVSALNQPITATATKTTIPPSAVAAAAECCGQHETAAAASAGVGDTPRIGRASRSVIGPIVAERPASTRR